MYLIGFLLFYYPLYTPNVAHGETHAQHYESAYQSPLGPTDYG